LREACEAGRVRELRGFGKATERRWIEQIDAKRERRRAVLLPEADGQAAALLEHLRRHPAVRAVELAGDLRRRTETVDRLELVVATSEPEVVAEHARQMPGLATLDSDASDRAVLHRVGALDAHLHFVPQRDFAVAWIAATGSRAHTAKLARIASRKRLSLDGRALRASTRRVAIASEQDLYERLGLAYVPPEMREDWGELEAAENGTLSTDLVTAGDVRGAVHCHTVDSDGKHTIEQMARAAEALGLQYLTITDHSVTASYAGGLDVDRLRRQADEIARVQSRVGIRLLRGTESDILRDGSLDYPDEVLEQLDVVIASVHQRHKMDTDQMTRRLLRAIRHPLFKIWGHALGRYVLSRPPFECRMDEVLDAVAESRAAIEINGDPHRLDLEPRWIRRARERGIRFVVSTDAHSTRGLENVRFGIDMARRGGLRKRDVLNTLGPEEFLDTVRPAARERRSTPGRRPTRRRA
jgi:DNA polymerase (family 10)